MTHRRKTEHQGKTEVVAYYYTRDHLGSVRELTNASGTVEARYKYDPYGNVTPIGTISVPSDFQYAGYYEHAPSGLNLTFYRAYDSNTGRWLARDPIAERGGINLYDYVMNNSVNRIDPLGLSGQFNPLLFTIGVINMGRSGIKLLTAAGMFAVGTGLEGVPVLDIGGTGLLAGGFWNTFGGLALANRGTNEIVDSLDGNTPGPEWQNLLGLLPFGGKMDTSCKAKNSLNEIENSSLFTWISEIASGT